MGKLIVVLFFLSIISCSQSKKEVRNAPVSQSPIINGISLVATQNPFPNENLTELKKLNTNWVAWSPFGFIRTGEYDVEFNHKWQWWGEKLEGTGESVKLLHEQGFKVMLKPQIWRMHGEYTGFFKAETDENWKTWEDSYSQFILSFAKVAQENQVELFCVGTELKSTIENRPEFWFDLIQKVKEIYKGKLIYAANWDDYKDVPFWKELDYIGVDAYFPLSDEKNPNKEELINGWQPWKNELKTFSEQQKMKIIFTEIGYRNSDYTAKEPWAENNKTRNDEAQTIAFQALFDVVNQQEWYAGMFIWKWFLDTVEYRPEHADFTPQQKPVEKVISERFSE